jgi:hypothetical protein
LCLLAVTRLRRECLHGPTESAEQAARRREALTAVRNINNLEANQPGAANRSYLSADQLASSPYAARMRDSPDVTVKRLSLNPGTDILPNWQLTLDVTTQGYWFMLKDKTDPCGFAFVSNQAGLIFRAEPIR